MPFHRIYLPEDQCCNHDLHIQNHPVILFEPQRASSICSAASTHADLAQDGCRPNPTPSGRLRKGLAAHRAILEGRSYQKGPKELESAEPREAVESMYVDSFKAHGDMRAHRAKERVVNLL